MGGSTPRETTQTTKNEPPSWAVPHYQSLINQSAALARRPYTPYTGEQVAGLTPQQLVAQQMVTDRALGPSAVDSGTGFARELLGGQGQFQGAANPYQGQATSVGSNPFAGSNPHLGQMIDQSLRDVTDAYNRSAVPSMMAQFNSGGAFGGSAHMEAMSQSQDALAKQLGNLSNQYRFQDYQTQQGLAEAGLDREQDAWESYLGRQVQTLGILPTLDQAGYFGAQQLAGVGDANQQLTQQMLDANYGTWLEARDWQANQLGLLGNALNAVQGGFQNSASTAPNLNRPNPWAGALGGAASGAAAGSAIPGIGTGVGAAVGGLLGYFGSR